MPFTIRPYRRFPVSCPVTYQTGLFEGQGAHHQPEHASDVSSFSQELRRLKNELMSPFEKGSVRATLHDIVNGLKVPGRWRRLWQNVILKRVALLRSSWKG